jgi:hypothetical protein
LGRNTRSGFSNSGKMSGRLLGCGASHSCKQQDSAQRDHVSGASQDQGRKGAPRATVLLCHSSTFHTMAETSSML